jgi:malonyl-CoA/methylmalonyl-CoA synthetase
VRELTEGSLVDCARLSAERYPDREAIRVGDEAITHAALDERSRRLAAWLRHHGVRLGSTVLVGGANSLEFVVCYVAALRAGARVTTVSASLQGPELATLVEIVRPDMSLVSADCDVKLGPSGWPSARLLTDDDGPDSTSAAIATSAPGDDPPIPSSAGAHLAFTSGTTGRPKAVPLTHANVLASVRAIMLAWRWSTNDILVHALPLQHAHGLTAVQLSLISGSRSVVLTAFEANSWCDTVAAHRATAVFCVPAMYERLLTWGRLGDADLSSLRLATSGSAPLSTTVSDAVAEQIGQRPLERYGLTEAGFVLSNLYDDRRAGTVGFPLPGIEVAIVDGDGQPVATEADGEIVVRGPQVFAGYGTAADNTSAFLAGGWFRTGDLGRRSARSGAISITGRIKDLIISGGMNVSPREVETVLESLPGVRGAAVVGSPSQRWGEEVCAFLVTHDPIDIAAIDRSIRDRLAPHKCPKRYALVDALPRNGMGKLERVRLPPFPPDSNVSP